MIVGDSRKQLMTVGEHGGMIVEYGSPGKRMVSVLNMQ